MLRREQDILIILYMYTCYFLFAYGQLGADLKKKILQKNITLWSFYHMAATINIHEQIEVAIK